MPQCPGTGPLKLDEVDAPEREGRVEMKEHRTEVGAEVAQTMSEEKREKKQQGAGSGSQVGVAPGAGCKATSCCCRAGLGVSFP